MVAADDPPDDVALVALAGIRPQRRKPEQRSHEHTAVARHAKALKRSGAEKEVIRQQFQHSQQQLAVVSALAPDATVQATALSDGQLVSIRLLLACAPTRRGGDQRPGLQAKCAAAVAACILQVQKACLVQRFQDVSSELLRVFRPERRSSCPAYRVHTYCMQWDETSQKIRALATRSFPHAHVSHRQHASQIMMQHGCMHVDLFMEDDSVSLSEPLFVRGLVLKEQKADHLIEGLLRGQPLGLDVSSSVEALSGKCDAFVLSWTVDRAAVNSVVSRWLLSRCLSASKVLCHVEPCWAHGVSLIKGRPTMGKRLAVSLNSLSYLLRTPRTLSALRECVARIIGRRLVVKQEPRLDVYRRRAQCLFETLFGPDDAEYLYRFDKHGNKVPGKVLEDIRTFLGLVDIDPDRHDLVHWCCGEGGNPCCTDREEAVERTTIAALNFLFGHGWETAAVSRWTHTNKLAKRWLVGTFAGQLLPQALKELQATWDVDASMITTLERLVAADSGDFSSQNKLRLLRICRTLCAPGAHVEMMLMVVTTKLADDMLYQILGHRRNRSSLFQLAHPASSPIPVFMGELSWLLTCWGGHEAAWMLLSLVGGDFASADLRVQARRQILQLLAGCFDLFEVRLSSPPYNLLALCHSDLSVPQRRDLVRGFMAENYACLPPLAKRLRDMFGTIPDMIFKAPRVLESWAKHTFCAIDFCERSHAAMRQDLRSAGRAKSFTASANRMLCRQMVSEHVCRGGTALSAQGVASLDSRSGCSAQGEASTSGVSLAGHPGNPFIRFRNAKVTAWKAVHAPDRPLTRQEREELDHMSKQAWASLKEDSPGDFAAQLLVNRAASARSCTTLAPRSPEQAGHFTGLWGNDSKPQPIAADTLLQHGVACRRQLALSRVWNDSDLIVDEVADRSRDAHGEALNVFGCCAAKKNVCRSHGVLTVDEIGKLDFLTSHISHWVDSLGKDQAGSCGHLLWLCEAPACSDTHNTPFLAQIPPWASKWIPRPWRPFCLGGLGVKVCVASWRVPCGLVLFTGLGAAPNLHPTCFFSRAWQHIPFIVPGRVGHGEQFQFLGDVSIRMHRLACRCKVFAQGPGVCPLPARRPRFAEVCFAGVSLRGFL